MWTRGGEGEERVTGASKDAKDGLLTPRKIAQRLRTTSEDLARSAGLGRGAVQRWDRIASGETQRRLRELVAVIDRVAPRLGSALMAYAWYRSEPLPGFSGQTAMQLLRCGRAEDVFGYIDAVYIGVHA